MNVQITGNLDRQTDRQTGISAECSNCLKGIFAVCVLAHHLYQNSGLFQGTAIGSCLQALGYLSVSVFFFLSGYGLSASYRRGGEAYVGRFPRRRLMPFYCFILFFTAVYFAKGVLFGRTYSVCAIVKSLIFGGTIIANGWYLQIQLLLYLMFFATFRVAKESRTQLTAICLECLTLSAALYALDYYSWWFEGTFAFPAGMLWEMRESGKSCHERKKTTAFWQEALICVLFGGMIIGWKMFDNANLALLCKMISAVLFPMAVAGAVRYIPVENRMTRWLGKYSAEIYVVQGLFLGLFHSQLLMIENPYLYVIAAGITTLAAAVLLHPVVQRIYAAVRK